MTEIYKSTVQVSSISLGADHASCIMAKRRRCVACKMSSYRKGLDTTWCVKNAFRLRHGLSFCMLATNCFRKYRSEDAALETCVPVSFGCFFKIVHVFVTSRHNVQDAK
uniref:Uncharacterized protein n=1 Tax=Anopheles arabiensis TaxID=7173 RepID=A0A499FTW3_ANOAR